MEELLDNPKKNKRKRSFSFIVLLIFAILITLVWFKKNILIWYYYNYLDYPANGFLFSRFETTFLYKLISGLLLLNLPFIVVLRFYSKELKVGIITTIFLSAIVAVNELM